MARSTAQRVAATLRDRIEGGGLPPGTQLSEEALGRDLGVSRNTLREAFRLLVHESLVVHRLNRGVFVRVLEPADVRDIYRMRGALETAGVRAAATAPHALHEAVRGAVTHAEQAASEGDWQEVGSADLRFHRALAALADSARVDAAMDRLMAELRLAFHEMPSPRRFHEPFVARNRSLAALLERGEYERAEAELTTYLDDALRLILDAMREAGR
ncbi:GntR family transcriptional regulator [Streptomyces griseocarneus]|uniref:GntR family transcriptional regulator n=1 Tax=Streptomyces griseocarneus TaxID=51201 RepID=UPI00167C8CF4|nr:GntR family transcriptional regulator [Streptomyces griseocarneus]MBZ6477570.1 GntR family transcriptional regulator [Streptomyces griseocarneus]GHG82433.1 GntR family transcriptional regulator [Streptomyces griseocarneus]